MQANRTVANRFGFRRVFFDRIDSCFAEALAWIPQSTVALNTYYGAFALEAQFPATEVLLQVHDSLVFQLPKTALPPTAALRKALEVVTPYPDPLTIPWDLKCSEQSWGDMQKVD